MKYLLTKGYPVQEVPLSDRHKIGEQFLDTYRDYGRGELEHLRDRLERTGEVITAILKVIPEGALEKIATDLNFKIKDSSTVKTKGK